MKKKLFSLFLFTVTIVILFGLPGCNFPMFNTEGEKAIDITEVTVTLSSPGTYSLGLKYSRILSKIPVTITCSYSTPDTNTFAILTLYDDGAKSPSTISTSKDFSVSHAGGEPTAGLYTAICSTDIGDSSKSTVFTVGDASNANVAIVSVTVSGRTNTNFALELVYLIRISDAVTFICNYVTPDGATMPIDNFIDDHHLPASPVIKTSYFSIPDEVLKSNPGIGIYTATCQDDEGRSKKSTTFTAGMEQEEPAPTLTPSLNLTTRVGQLLFDYTNTQSDRPSAGGEVKLVTDLCIPEITVGSDGALSGLCEKSNMPGHLVTDATITVQVAGTVDSTGNIIFTYDVSEIGNPNGAWRVSYNGQGKFSSTTQAMGTANFSYSCQSGQDNLLWCNSETYENFSGTLPWSFSPAR